MNDNINVKVLHCCTKEFVCVCFYERANSEYIETVFFNIAKPVAYSGAPAGHTAVDHLATQLYLSTQHLLIVEGEGMKNQYVAYEDHAGHTYVHPELGTRILHVQKNK